MALCRAWVSSVTPLPAALKGVSLTFRKTCHDVPFAMKGDIPLWTILSYQNVDGLVGVNAVQDASVPKVVCPACWTGSHGVFVVFGYTSGIPLDDDQRYCSRISNYYSPLEVVLQIREHHLGERFWDQKTLSYSQSDSAVYEFDEKS